MTENQQARPPIFLYTDGAASGNPGPGATEWCSSAMAT